MKAAPTVAILTCRNDFHALVVQRGYRELTGADCVIVETDSFAGSDGMTWRSHRDGRSTVSASGLHHDVDDFDLVWYRRANMPQHDVPVGDADHRQFVNTSIGAALRGTLETSFRGVWLSHPEATQRAENKLIQLDAAVAAGLAVPRTLVTQNPDAVREFYDAMGGAVVMKALRFSRRQPLLTLSADREMLADDDAIRLCPTLFQELVPGERHLRVLAIDKIHAIAVDTPHLDWRPHLDADASTFVLDDSTCEAIQRLLTILGLRMGVLDSRCGEARPCSWRSILKGNSCSWRGSRASGWSNHSRAFCLTLHAAVPLGAATEEVGSPLLRICQGETLLYSSKNGCLQQDSAVSWIRFEPDRNSYRARTRRNARRHITSGWR